MESLLQKSIRLMQGCHLILMFVLTTTAILICAPAIDFAQVSPAELKNPQLQAIEKAYLTPLMAAKRAIAKLKFPYSFTLSRYVGLDPAEQAGADERGLEFVNFRGRTILKLTGNYNAAYNADRLTPNQRSNRVFDDVVTPLLQLLPKYFSPDDTFDAFGFEISYHVQRKTRNYEFEGKENFVFVIDKTDVAKFFNAREDSDRQEVLDRSDSFLDGKEFGLALGQREAFHREAADRSSVNQTLLASARAMAPHSGAQRDENFPNYHTLTLKTPGNHASSEPDTLVAPPATQADATSLQSRYQSQLDALAKEGTARYHFVEYAPPSFVIFQNKLFLQLTLRNPTRFEKNATSIYKRAAQSFDLFLATQLKPILDSFHHDSDFSGLDITVLHDLNSKSGHSSEALEFVCPLKALRRFAEAEMTNQELINQSAVLVNGVRIALNLQQVE